METKIDEDLDKNKLTDFFNPEVNPFAPKFHDTNPKVMQDKRAFEAKSSFDAEQNILAIRAEAERKRQEQISLEQKQGIWDRYNLDSLLEETEKNRSLSSSHLRDYASFSPYPKADRQFHMNRDHSNELLTTSDENFMKLISQHNVEKELFTANSSLESSKPYDKTKIENAYGQYRADREGIHFPKKTEPQFVEPRQPEKSYGNALTQRENQMSKDLLLYEKLTTPVDENSIFNELAKNKNMDQPGSIRNFYHDTRKNELIKSEFHGHHHEKDSVWMSTGEYIDLKNSRPNPKDPTNFNARINDIWNPDEYDKATSIAMNEMKAHHDKERLEIYGMDDHDIKVMYSKQNLEIMTRDYMEGEKLREMGRKIPMHYEQVSKQDLVKEYQEHINLVNQPEIERLQATYPVATRKIDLQHAGLLTPDGKRTDRINANEPQPGIEQPAPVQGVDNEPSQTAQLVDHLKNSPVIPEPAPAKNPNALHGTLIEHGSKPFKPNDEKTLTPYVIVQDDAGRKHQKWGVDLPRALDESGANIGDKISIEKVEVEKVKIPEMDEHGNRNMKSGVRNTWEINKLDLEKAKTLEQAKASSKAVQNEVKPEPVQAKDVEQPKGSDKDKKSEYGSYTTSSGKTHNFNDVAKRIAQQQEQARKSKTVSMELN